jgi:hypothetical protein
MRKRTALRLAAASAAAALLCACGGTHPTAHPPNPDSSSHLHAPWVARPTRPRRPQQRRASQAAAPTRAWDLRRRRFPQAPAESAWQSDSCYWAIFRSGPPGSIIQNDIVNGGKPPYPEARAGTPSQRVRHLGQDQ